MTVKLAQGRLHTELLLCLRHLLHVLPTWSHAPFSERSGLPSKTSTVQFTAVLRAVCRTRVQIAPVEARGRQVMKT